jgi:hypothetical protein
MTLEVSREQVLAFRWHAQQLDRPAGSATDADLLDLGVQDTGAGAAWALTQRGVAEPPSSLLAWTLRGAPHLYRRADAAAVATATSPFSDADAGKRIYDAATPLRRAGLGILEGLREVAEASRAIVDGPTVKGELSAGLTAVLDPVHLRHCVPCDAIHPWEMPFRLAALQAGLELEPSTSPPVLRRVSGFEPPLFGQAGGEAEPRLHVVRAYLRFFGPATPKDVAAYLDAPVAEVRGHWPEDAVQVDGGWVLAADVDALTAPVPPPVGDLRLLGAFDPWLQLRDRETLVADPARRKDLWRNLGRPGAVVVDGEVVGTWRPRSAGKKLTLHVDHWGTVDRSLDAAVREQAELLATHRGQVLHDVVAG